ncbi:MAG: bifunctional DNA-formamidopyrimidine glycosylase/DNA-(apurinic or apyrimidinic site) lyase [Pontimonas sp.]|nr:bifunctional DNA-formamidopyrimidine glycosylase/DNA-(apurinic or apyrimidinic site) lyase [Pontimonas sp.]
MPELPEVEVVRSGLESALTGATIDRVKVLEPRSLKRHPGPPEDFVERLEGQVVDAALRRGKFLWFPLRGSEEALVVHLGMSGQVLLGDESSDFGSLLRIRFDITTAQGDPMVVGFVDQRIFGSMAIDEVVVTPDGQPAGRGSSDPRIPRSVAHIARDPLDPHFDDRAFSRALRAKNTDIKRALLDQTLISGIGNIYADEALWGAKLHYLAPTWRLTAKKVRELLTEIRVVLEKALVEGGTSFDSQYVNVNGQAGYFAHSLHAYGRQGTPCDRCGAIIRREPFMNRSSHRCPSCQRTPRNR